MKFANKFPKNVKKLLFSDDNAFSTFTVICSFSGYV